MLEERRRVVEQSCGVGKQVQVLDHGLRPCTPRERWTRRNEQTGALQSFGADVSFTSRSSAERPFARLLVYMAHTNVRAAERPFALQRGR